MPLRACVFQDFKSTGDGLQKDSLVVIDTLKELGYEVHLCSLRSPNMEGARRNFGKELKVSSVTIPRFIFHSNRLNLIRSAIVHVEPRVDADVFVNMMAHWFPMLKPHSPRKQVLYVGALPKVPVPMNGYDNGIGYLEKSFRRALNSLITRKLQKLLEEATVVTASKYLKNVLSEVWKVDATVLYPPVDFDAYQSTMKDIEQKDLNSIALAGRFTGCKNFEMGISVAEKIDDSEIRIIAARDNEPYFESIKAQISRSPASNRIRLHLDLPLNIRADLLKRSKVFVHAAMGEGFGAVVAEAMAAGCIPIVHDSGGPSEYVPEKWRYRSSSECLSKVKEALNASPQEHMEIVKLAEQFSEKHYKESFIQIINELS